MLHWIWLLINAGVELNLSERKGPQVFTLLALCCGHLQSVSYRLSPGHQQLHCIIRKKIFSSKLFWILLVLNAFSRIKRCLGCISKWWRWYTYINIYICTYVCACACACAYIYPYVIEPLAGAAFVKSTTIDHNLWRQNYFAFDVWILQTMILWYS